MEKTFNAKLAEERLYSAWEEANAFAAGANASPGADRFSIMIPPPNVTGSLHMGHAFNNTLQDILVRWHRMRGFDTLWQPGTDHAGIATQMVVERELALQKLPTRQDMGREAFLAKIWEWKKQSGGTIITQLKRLGASCDWSREAFTMSGNFPDAVTKVFVEMFHKGLIYRGKRLVNWDPHFETAISDLEVENIDSDGHMWHFKYPLAGGETYEYIEKDEEGAVTFREIRNYISIATTRPETMLGDGAIAVHPSDSRYAPIVGRMVQLPLCDRLIPIITDEYPDPNFGSGAVKITGAHDFNDYQVAKRAGLPLYRLMDTRGYMRADGASYADNIARVHEISAGSTAAEAEIDALNLVPEKYRGLCRFDARKQVVEDITTAGLAVTILLKEIDEESGAEHLRLEPVVESKKIMQPFGDRSKVVIEPMLTDQWFVDTHKIVGPALDAVRSGATKIIPESGEKTYFHWLENIEPWCISRQLWWGHQIPVWYDDEGQSYCAVSKVEAQALAQGRKLTRDPDVLDTWFSSGLWPIGTLGWPNQTPELKRYFPTSTLITGADIIFFWVARMMMMQLAVVDEVPFKTVYLHGLVRDSKGKKMSKSLGNVIDPLDVIDEFGADALRFANAAMASLGGTLKMDTQRITGYRNFGTKLWNACRFAEMNGVWESHATQATPPQAKATVNRWIIAECAALRLNVDKSFAQYRFDDAANGLYAFVWGKVCDWYVEFSKPLFGTDEAEETRRTMAWVLDQSMIMLHPIMPFITEELWGTTGVRAKMLVHTDWPLYGAELHDETAMLEMNWVTGLIEEVRSVRAQMHVPAGLRVQMLCHNLEPIAQQALSNNEALILRLSRLEAITVSATTPKGAITVSVVGGNFSIPLAGIINIGEEKERLNKSLEKLKKELDSVRGRLNNPNFVTSAPAEVVVESRDKLAFGDSEVNKLTKALERLAEIG